MADVLERDAGFCSGGEEEDMEAEDGIHSPTDASEDSVDVKVQAISLRNKNKRKCAEPRRLDTDLPAKKRKISLAAVEKNESGTETCNPGPFRPWSCSPVSHRRPREERPRCPPSTNRTELLFRPETYYPQARIPPEYGIVYLPELPSPPHPSLLAPSPLPRAPVPFYPIAPPYVRPPFPVSRYQDEPLSLVSKKKETERDSPETEEPTPPLFSPALRLEKNSSFKPVGGEEPEKNARTWHSPVVDFSQKTTEETGKVKEKEKEKEGTRWKNSGTSRSHSDKKCKSVSEKILKIKTEENCHQNDNKFRIDNLLSSVKSESGSTSASASSSSSKPGQGSQQRNYKNMTRERRIEANARERTRVHTISAAFDTLRHSIPAYSHNQKLSKLSVLRIACSYIMTLSRLAGYDYSKDQTQPDLADCVDNVSKTIQTEGKIRKKKED